MFEVKIIKGSYCLETITCNVGDLLPKIASLLQIYEGDGWAYQQGYAITWRRVKE